MADLQHNTQSQKEKEKSTVKKVLRYVVIVFAALAVLLGVLFLIDKLMEKEKFDFRQKAEGVYFFPADYNANPADDPAYMAKDRSIWFSDDKGVGAPLEPAVASTDTVQALMYKYFTSLMEGDAKTHSTLLSKAYNEKYVVQDKFTPQKVHDIRISFNQSGNSDNGYHWYYRVSYKIYENNGTYRADIGSETARVMSFEIVYEDNCYKINSIGYITAKTDGDN